MTTVVLLTVRNRRTTLPQMACQAGVWSQSRKESEVLGSSRIPKNTRSRIFCPTPKVQLDHFLYHTQKSGIPVEMVQFVLKLLLKQNSCCAPRFPFSASCYKILDSHISFTLCWGVGNFGKVRVGVGHVTSDPATLLPTAEARRVNAAQAGKKRLGLRFHAQASTDRRHLAKSSALKSISTTISPRAPRGGNRATGSPQRTGVIVQVPPPSAQ